jgi:hypothetical protein
MRLHQNTISIYISGSHGGDYEITDSSDVILYSLVDIYQRFRENSSLHLRGERQVAWESIYRLHGVIFRKTVKSLLESLNDG